MSAEIIKMGGALTRDLLQREQIAAQVVAVMQAHFSRPDVQEMREILKCAEGQIQAIELGIR